MEKMKIGQKVKVHDGEYFLLDIQKDYLILFNEKKGEFVKANGPQKEDELVFWRGGDYYRSFSELIANL